MGYRIILLMLIALVTCEESWAHVVYRDLLRDNLNSHGQFQGTVTNNYGWIDGADIAPNDTLPLGDTHRVYWARFSIANPSHVSILVRAQTALEGSSAIYLGDLTPAFSLFSGLSPSLGHDGAHPDCGAAYGNGCHGVLDVLHDFTMWNSQGQSGELRFIGYALTSDGVSAGETFLNLSPGNYTVIIGGANASVLPNGTSMPVGTRAFTVTMSIITPVPIPAAGWLFLSSLATLFVYRRSEKSQT
ncbi:MAG: hypothetical protein NHB36_05310 [Nitrospira sp.]|nr:hypothetical protein [Nitrospira sp.]